MSTFLRERLCCQPAPTACRRHPTHSNFQMRLAILLMVVLPCDALLAPAALPRLGAAPAAGARRRANIPPFMAASAAGASSDDPSASSATIGTDANVPAALTPAEARRINLSVAATLSAAFLNLLGFTMAGPITPALGAHFGLSVGASLGALTSAYPLGMLAGLFFWPALSDRVGRKPVIALSLLGSGLGLAAQGLAVQASWSLNAFLALRVLTGSMAGSSPVAKAYLADLGSGVGKLPRYMAWRDAASTLAFIVGPLLSGQLYLRGHRALGAATTADRSLSAVIGTSGAGSLLAAVLVFLFVSEVPSPKRVAVSSTSSSSSSSGAAPPAPLPPSPEQLEQETREGILACPLGNRLFTAVATVWSATAPRLFFHDLAVLCPYRSSSSCSSLSVASLPVCFPRLFPLSSV